MRRYEDTAQILEISYDCPVPRSAEVELAERKGHLYRELRGLDIQRFYEAYNKEDEIVRLRNEFPYEDSTDFYEQQEQINLQKITEAIFEAVFSKHDAIRLKDTLKMQESERFTFLTDSLISAILHPNLQENEQLINDYLFSTDTDRDALLFGRCGDGIDIARAYISYLQVGFDPTNIPSRNELFIRLSVLSNLKELLNRIPIDSEDALLFRNSVHHDFEYIVQTIELVLSSLELNGWDKSTPLEDQFEYLGLIPISSFYKFKFEPGDFRHFFKSLNNKQGMEIKFKYSSQTRIVKRKDSGFGHIIFPLNAFNPRNVESKGAIIRNFLNRLNVAAAIFNGKKLKKDEPVYLGYTDLTHPTIYKLLNDCNTVGLDLQDNLVDILINQQQLGIQDRDCAKGVLKYLEYEIMTQEQQNGAFLVSAAMHHEA